MTPYQLNLLPARELVKGITGRFVHTEKVTIGYVDIVSGSTLPEHHHVHEQITTVLEGALEITVEGVKHLLQAGHVLVIPSNARHSAIALSDCKVIDVFNPVREDYKF
ncbi:MAG: cupin domain-containing protein [Chitinophagales bacterium]|nr:cupin domain-containing protein [Chitinophagales bacterium]